MVCSSVFPVFNTDNFIYSVLLYKYKFIFIFIFICLKKDSLNKQLDAAIAEARSNLDSFKSETYLETLKNIRKDKKDLYTAEQELNKATTLNGKSQIMMIVILWGLYD